MQYGSRKRLSAKGSGLYLVLEDIEEGNGDESGLIAQKFATRNEIKDFTNTANSFRAVGVEARHASILIGTPIAKMTLK